MPVHKTMPKKLKAYQIPVYFEGFLVKSAYPVKPGSYIDKTPSSSNFKMIRDAQHNLTHYISDGIVKPL
jgi:hypothetical protein